MSSTPPTTFIPNVHFDFRASCQIDLKIHKSTKSESQHQQVSPKLN